MKGHLKLTKIYDDHEEVVLDEHNILTVGTSVEIVDVMTDTAGLIEPLKPYYLQGGTSRVDEENATQNAEGSSLFYHVSAPVTSISIYGDDCTLELVNLYRSFLASSNDSAATTPVYQEMLFLSAPLSATQVSSTESKEWFAKVDPVYKTKLFIDTFEVRMRFDRLTLQNTELTEFGLYAKNPHGFKDDRPFLLAYKKLTGSITKKLEFDLLVEWSIGFIGNSTVYDDQIPGAFELAIHGDGKQTK